MRLLITRPEPKASVLARELERRGHATLIEPLLTIEPAADRAPRLAGVQAIVLTSANALSALTDEMCRLPVFAVGAATAGAARAAGCREIHPAGGEAASLARLIAGRCRPEDGALLHLAGVDVREGLADALTDAGFELRRQVAYRAVAASSLSAATVTAIRAHSLDAVLLFSPRTAAIFTRLVEQQGLQPYLDTTEAICLSAAVAASCRSLVWRAVRIAARPRLEDLLQILAAPSPAP